MKVYLLINGKRVKKKKTAPKKGSCNPVWNEALIFSLSASNLPNAAIEVQKKLTTTTAMTNLFRVNFQVCVMDQANDLIGNNPLVGCCVIGPKETGPERDHWIDMTQSPRKAVACWHTMR